ncbi:MAG TPA: VOC family protein [Stellaceae bacterium]|nr:VOC family protein [Stellaceae bacterium]
MLDHIGINVSDLARSKAFYEAALAPLGYRVRKEIPDAIGFGVPEGHGKSTDPAGEFWIAKGPPLEPRPHFAFNAASRAVVDAFHKAALAAGGRDNGAPGLRPRYHANYYGAFILDPDGYNIEAVCHAADS